MNSLIKEDMSVSFDAIEDPRTQRSKKYPISEIIFLCIFSTIHSIESWRGTELLGNEKLDFLRRFFPFKNGIPSHQTLARVFSLLKPKSFESFFISWSANLNGTNKGKQIAFDGKALRGSFDKSSGKKALHMLNACAVDNGLSLAQLEVDAKTNEITTLPEMIESLDIAGAMVSVDALNTQKEIAAKIIGAGADYTLALKGNHKTLNEEAQYLFNSQKIDLSPDSDFHIDFVDKGHGRITERHFDVIKVDQSILPQIVDWKGLEAVGRVETTTLRDGKETFETRFYLLSYSSSELFAKSAKGHWEVENLLHWTLDVTFDEDASRKRKDHAPRNYALIRKFALNILRGFKGKLSIPLAQIKAAANSEYLRELLVAAGFKLRLQTRD